MRSRRHALGQNFLHHKPTIQKIVNACRPHLEHARSILEVGPGKLAITKDLVALAAEANLPLILVERDRKLEETISTELQSPNLNFMDAASDDFVELLDSLERENKTPVLFVSNLPYSASSQILANLCARSALISRAIVMVQKELAERMYAKHGTSDRGSFSILMETHFHVKKLFDVGPGAFNPPPKVMSTVLDLEPLRPSMVAGLSSPEKFQTFCKTLFSQRRKMVRNLIPTEKHGLFPKFGISGTERPEALKTETVIELFKAIDES